jgi:ATP-binding cassette subfamily B protein
VSDFGMESAGGGMAAGSPPRRPRANLGTNDEEEIFATFDRRIVSRFGTFLKPHWKFLVIAQVAVLASAISGIQLPRVIGHAVDSATGVGTSGRALDVALMALGGYVLMNAVFAFLDQWTTSRLAQAVIFDVRRAMFSHFQKVSLSFMDKTHVGRIMSRLQGDVGALQEFLESSTGVIGDIVTLIGITIMLLAMNWKLGLLTMLVLPAMIGIRAIWLPYSKKTFMAARVRSSVANGALAENINGIRTVQETRREAMNFELYEEKNEANFKAQVDSSFMSQIMTPTVDILTGLAMATVIVVGGNEVLHGELRVGAMVAYILFVQRFFEPVRMLSMQYTVMQRAMAAGARIFEVLDVPIAIDV